MGKKYIIELKDNTAWLQWVNVVDDGQVRFDFKYPEDLTPYTEPDIEQIRKEAYQRGLSDAWEAARKLYLPIEYGGIPVNVLHQMFDNKSIKGIFMKVSVSEVIEKIRQYKQEKEEERITKGDVVRIKSVPEVEILVTYAYEGYVSGIALTNVDNCCEVGDQYTDVLIRDVEKTGEHYEIAEVLKKMKESEP